MSTPRADTIDPPAHSTPAFLAGGGEMGARIRAHDWMATPMGPVEGWPAALRTTLRIMLSTDHPVFIFWGPELICFYNDAYSRSLGPERHPGILGMRGRVAWDEIWHIIGPQIEQCMAGRGATWHENHLVPITRHGVLEEVYWTYSYGPIDDETAAGGIGGVLVLCNETTAQVRAEQRLRSAQSRWRALFDQAPGFICVLEGPEHRYEYVNRRYADLVGGRAVIGRPVAECLPEVVDQGFLTLLDRVYASGEPYLAQAARVTLVRPDGAGGQTLYLDFVYQPIHDEDGRIGGIFVQGSDVTERTLAAQTLQSAEQRARERAEELEAVMNSVPAAIWIAHDRGCLQVSGNAHARELLAVDPGINASASGAQAALRHFREFIDGRPAHPDDLPLQRAARTGQPVPVAEVAFVFDDGSVRHIYGGASPLYDATGEVRGAVGGFIEVTGLKEAQARLQARERELRTLADNTPDALARYDREHRHVFVNAAVESLTGLPREAFIGRTAAELGMPGPLADRCDAALRDVFDTGQPRQIELDYTPRGQPTMVCLARLVPERDGSGAVTHVLVIAQDISERRRAELAVRDADRRKDEFLATLAHELRNPLAPLRSGLELLDRGTDPQSLAGVRRMMRRQLAQIVRLIDDLLEISRISAGKLTLQREVISLQAALELGIEASRPALDAGRHQLDVKRPDEPLWVHADLTRLAQVLANLLNNAAKYTPDGGHVEVVLQAEGDLGVIRVSDDGLGLPPDMLTQIFEMFTQVDSTLNRAKGGLGIGLNLARNIVELHGGTIDAHSAGLGRGTTFTCRLPLVVAGGPSTAD